MLTHLRLTGFKSFEDEEVPFAGFTVLVGANAAGKSNLLDAVRFLQGVALDMTLADAIRGRWEGGRQTWPGIRGGTADIALRGHEEFTIQSTWRLEGETIEHLLGVEVGPHPLLTRERLTSSEVRGYLFDTHAAALGEGAGRDEGASIKVALKRTGKGNSPNQTHSASRSLLHQLDLAPPVSPEVRRVASLLRSAMRSAYFLDITPARMRGYVPKHLDVLGLEGENLSALVWSICQDEDAKLDLVEWLSEVCALEVEDIEFVETSIGDVMLVLVEEGGRRIPARSLSDGTLRFLGQLVALRKAPEGSLLLIEEVENGLHPTRIHLLVQAIEAAVEARSLQVIATTHSPLVLNALSPQTLRTAILAARPPEASGTVLRRLESLPNFDEVVQRRGIDRLLASGWLERAV